MDSKHLKLVASNPNLEKDKRPPSIYDPIPETPEYLLLMFGITNEELDEEGKDY